MSGQHSARLLSVPDSIQLDSSLSLTAFSSTQRCPGQHSARLSAVTDSIQLDSALSQTAFSLTHICPGQHSSQHNASPDSILLDSSLSRSAFRLTQPHCPGQNWLIAVLLSGPKKQFTMGLWLEWSILQFFNYIHSIWSRKTFFSSGIHKKYLQNYYFN